VVKGLDHIAINIVDLEKSLKFYRDILRLEELSRIDLEDHSLYYFRIEGSSRLELIVYGFDTPAFSAAKTAKGMYRHVAFRVDSVAEIGELCEKNGISILSRPAYVDGLKFTGMLIEDPNGVEIELVERS
jgi:catechol 2,3-dioxygenase-like lactoylglutathione lyase family enzyme